MLSRLLSAVGERLRMLDALLGRRRHLRLALTLLLLAPAVLLVVLVVVAVAERIAYPLDLEWLEGSQIYHAYRLLQGQPIYRVEASGFIPHPYPPVHTLLVAAVGAVVGLDFLSARAVSVAAFLISAVVISYQVWRQWPGREGRAALAVVSAGYIAATYGIVEGWYDIARIDSLMLVFVVLSAAPLARHELRWRDIFISATLASMSVYTKQTAVFFVVGLCLIVLWRDWKKGLVMGLAIGALCTAALVTLEHLTGGGFSFWLFNSRNQMFYPLKLADGAMLAYDRAPFLILFPFLLLPLLVRGRRWRWRPSARAALWLGLLVAAVPAGLIPFAKKGGYMNNLVPLLFLAGPTALIIFGDFARSARPATRRWILAVVLGLQAIYLPGYLFDPADAIPGANWRRRAESLTRTVAALEGGVICPICPYLPVRTGHSTPQASWMAHLDATWSRTSGLSAASYASWIHAVRPRWLLLCDDRVWELLDLRQALGSSYVFQRELALNGLEPLWLTNPVSRLLYRRVDSVPPRAVNATSRPTGRGAPP